MDIDSKIQAFSGKLIGMFSSPLSITREVLKKFVFAPDSYTLLIDTNHRWSSKELGRFIRIIQPQTLDQFLTVIKDLKHMSHPRLKSIVVDDLPLYFRDFYGSDKLHTQNMRAIGATLSLLSHTKSSRTFFVTYASGLNSFEPIFHNHFRYYADHMFYVTKNNREYHLSDIWSTLSFSLS